MYISTSDLLVSPVSANDLADFARLESDDPVIDTALLSATSIVFSYLKQDLLTRTWTLTHKDWPIEGTVTEPSIGRQNYAYKTRIELPYTNLINVDSVTVNGEAYTDYQIISGKPYSLEFDKIGYTQDDSDALVVVYSAGFGANSSDVPRAIRNAILMAASYIYNHNGTCDYADALTMSGAIQLLTPYAVNAGFVI